MKKLIVLTVALSTLTFLPNSSYAANITKTICDPIDDSDNGFGSGTYRGHFYSWFEISQNDTTNCDVKIGFYDEGPRHFRAEWSMAQSWGEDAVGGLGWPQGSRDRRIGYQVGELTTNSDIQKALVALYGWSCAGNTSQEYYVVETWQGPGQFVPWDETVSAPATKKGTVTANNATYDVYVVDRNGAQYCGNGESKAFKQYWSVRQSPTQVGANQQLDFRPHVNRWDNSDLNFNRSGLNQGYQIFAVEIFGDATLNHTGVVDASVWLR